MKTGVRCTCATPFHAVITDLTPVDRPAMIRSSSTAISSKHFPGPFPGVSFHFSLILASPNSARHRWRPQHRYTEVREKILDPAYAGWFLKFKPNSPYTSLTLSPFLMLFSRAPVRIHVARAPAPFVLVF